MSRPPVLRPAAVALGTLALLVGTGTGAAQADPAPAGQHGQSAHHTEHGHHGQPAGGGHGDGTKPEKPEKPHKPKKPKKPKKPHPIHPAHPAHPSQGSSTTTGSQGTHGAPSGPQSGPAAPSGAAQPQAAAKDPASNNGTIKIAPLGADDGTPGNTPHPGCGFLVEWYGFDEGADVVSTVSFAMHAPTKDVGLTVAGPTRVFVGADPASGAGTPTGLDGRQAYRLTFSGAPHPKQGFHVKVTVSTPRSRGNDTKSKVFWVAPCDAAAPVTGSAAPSGSPQVTAVSDGHGSSSTTPTGTGATRGVVQGVVEGVPTAVDAGAVGSDRSGGMLSAMTSSWGLGLTAWGLVLAGLAVALVRRRRA